MLLAHVMCEVAPLPVAALDRAGDAPYIARLVLSSRFVRQCFVRLHIASCLDTRGCSSARESKLTGQTPVVSSNSRILRSSNMRSDEAGRDFWRRLSRRALFRSNLLRPRVLRQSRDCPQTPELTERLTLDVDDTVDQRHCVVVVGFRIQDRIGREPLTHVCASEGVLERQRFTCVRRCNHLADDLRHHLRTCRTALHARARIPNFVVSGYQTREAWKGWPVKASEILDAFTRFVRLLDLADGCTFAFHHVQALGQVAVLDTSEWRVDRLEDGAEPRDGSDPEQYQNDGCPVRTLGQARCTTTSTRAPTVMATLITPAPR